MFKDLFSKSTKKKKYATIPSIREYDGIPEGILTKCPQCKSIMYSKELAKNFKICLECGYHHPLSARERLECFLDGDSFTEFDGDMQSENPLEFPGYVEKLEQDQKKSGLKEAVVTGRGRVGGHEIVIAVMDSNFRMGSMGSVVGEKITRAIEKADEESLPFIIFTASGGARMQEGVLSLMQMAKTSAALNRFSERGGLIITVMTHPTTGGVSASFASLGDYNLAEPGALIGFAGRRIIEQTIREKLPPDFQTAEFLLKRGQLDAVIPRDELREKIINILDIHASGSDIDW